MANKQEKASHEQIVEQFNLLRQQQQKIVTKITELEAESREHELVLETLKDTDKNRKCYRKVGGTLIERTVGEVIPSLTHNNEQIKKMITTLEAQMKAKGEELQQHSQKYGIRLKYVGDVDEGSSAAAKS